MQDFKTMEPTYANLLSALEMFDKAVMPCKGNNKKAKTS